MNSSIRCAGRIYYRYGHYAVCVTGEFLSPVVRLLLLLGFYRGIALPLLYLNSLPTSPSRGFCCNTLLFPE